MSVAGVPKAVKTV